MLKVAVVGLGSISQLHIDHYVNNDDVQLIALCDKNKERLKQVADRYDVTYRYTEIEDLLANKEIDAISICTWNNFHAPMAIAALEAGKHVLIEKPLSVTVEESLQIEQAVHRSGKILQVGYVRRHSTSVQIVKEMVDKGTFGEIYYAKASCLRRAGNPGGWFTDKARSGGGPLIDLGVHMLDLLWYLMGKPKPLTVSGNTYEKLGDRHHIQHLSSYRAIDGKINESTVEDMANALIRFENGASIYVDVSFTLHAKQDEVNAKLYGEHGGVEIEPELVIALEKNDIMMNVTPQIDELAFDVTRAFSRQIDHFVQSCFGHEKPIAPVGDGVTMMKMLAAIYESAETGKEITL